MEDMASALKDAGYTVWNIHYPSRSNTIEVLSDPIRSSISSNSATADKLHFVTHSMGGILMRYMHSANAFTNLGRVVMLSPPNQGSEVVDKLGHLNTFRWINGPAGDQLGTSDTNILSSLPVVDFDLGILTGDRSINLVLSMLIPGDDDGKVSTDSAKCLGMKEFRVIHATHPFIMKNTDAIRFTLNFLEEGTFEEKAQDKSEHDDKPIKR
jgi:triacylglycerol lipase